MSWKTFGFAALFCLLVSPAFAAPDLIIVPGGVQGGNWVWNVNISPDVSLVPDNSGTPLGLELGFRLTGAPLLSATNINPGQFSPPNPGKVIFGWETLDPSANNHPVGLQVNTATGEIFAAFGSVNFTTGGPKPFLQIIASGPGNGGASFSSTLQWLGVYGAGSSQGVIAQVNGLNGSTYTVGNYYFSGSATQIPEPASTVLVATGAVAATIGLRRRRLAR